MAAVMLASQSRKSTELSESEIQNKEYILYEDIDIVSVGPIRGAHFTAISSRNSHVIYQLGDRFGEEVICFLFESDEDWHIGTIPFKSIQTAQGSF